ncbi:MAG: Ni/Fe hydrogenase subunit alpha [Synergistaceae bacterium]|jgi:NAD-reducing hydrogenase large subunit|nr:Ni/Fe hydrogenase subunit alpha [Synergistaceae bacterium]
MENKEIKEMKRTSGTIVVNPVTRIEGHGKITVQLKEDGSVESARMHVTQFRGFEIFTRGRDFREMPVITPRTCGICPVSHHLAAAKACDAIIGVKLSPSAHKLRDLMHMGQIVQSHALSFFHLSSPDLLFGFDANPATRNIVGVAESYPDLARLGIGIRKFGQEIIKTLGDKKIHPWHSIPGGVNRAIRKEERDRYLKELPGIIDGLQKAIELVKNYLNENAALAAEFATLSTAYLGLVRDGNLELYDGDLRLVSPKGRIIEEFACEDYYKKIGEYVVDWSYLKFPFYRDIGFPEGSYRVGPLGRVNACDKISTPLANEELRMFREAGDGRIVHKTLYFHYARLIEALYSAERIEELLNDPDIMGSDLRTTSNVLNREGVGVVEAPRGTLIHHYEVDARGAITKVNLIVATGHNNWAINRGVEQVAKQYITDGKNVPEGALNRMEHVIRCYDPCLSCSTHAVGKMPLELELLDCGGNRITSVFKA